LTPPQKTPQPFLNTPGKLPRFLSFVEKEFGVKDVMDYRAALEKQRIGPDVLHSIPDENLIALQIPIGDIHRLKQAASMWIVSDDAKKRTLPEPEVPAAPVENIRFEKRWKGTNDAATYWGTGIEPSSPPGVDVEYEWWYFAREFGKLVPLGSNFRPVLDPEFDDGLQNDDDV
jgi:hypothetical protein